MKRTQFKTEHLWINDSDNSGLIVKMERRGGTDESGGKFGPLGMTVELSNSEIGVHTVSDPNEKGFTIDNIADPVALMDLSFMMHVAAVELRKAGWWKDGEGAPVAAPAVNEPAVARQQKRRRARVQRRHAAR